MHVVLVHVVDDVHQPVPQELGSILAGLGKLFCHVGKLPAPSAKGIVVGELAGVCKKEFGQACAQGYSFANLVDNVLIEVHYHRVHILQEESRVGRPSAEDGVSRQMFLGPWAGMRCVISQRPLARVLGVPPRPRYALPEPRGKAIGPRSYHHEPWTVKSLHGGCENFTRSIASDAIKPLADLARRLLV